MISSFQIIYFRFELNNTDTWINIPHLYYSYNQIDAALMNETYDQHNGIRERWGRGRDITITTNVSERLVLVYSIYLKKHLNTKLLSTIY